MFFSVCGFCNQSREEPLIQLFHPNTIYSKQLSGYLQTISGVKVTPTNPSTRVVCVTCYDIAYDLHMRHQSSNINLKTEVKMESQYEQENVKIVDLEHAKNNGKDIVPRQLSNNIEICQKYPIVVLKRNDIYDRYLKKLKSFRWIKPKNINNTNLNDSNTNENKIKAKRINATGSKKTSGTKKNPWKVTPFLPTMLKKKFTIYKQQKKENSNSTVTNRNKATIKKGTDCKKKSDLIVDDESKNKSESNECDMIDEQFVQSLFKKHLKPTNEQAIQTDDYPSEIEETSFENILPELKKYDIPFTLSSDMQVCIQKKTQNRQICTPLQYWTYEETIDVYKPTINLRKRN